MFRHTRSDGQYIGIKDDILGSKAYLFSEQLIHTLTNLDASLIIGSLPFFVETHSDDCSTEPLHDTCLGKEVRLSHLQTDGINNAFSLTTLQPCLNHLEARTINHNRHTTDGGIGSHKIEKSLHFLLRVEHTIIHVDIDDHCSILHLFACDVERLVVVFLSNESQELPTTSHIASLAHFDECS